MDTRKKLLMLFRETFLISMFTVGGGYVIVPMMRKKFVEDLKLIEEDEMLDMIAIAQSAPGALATNASVILGYKIAQIWGALVACFATALPPLIIITIISFFYEAFRDNLYVNHALTGMAAGVSAIIIVAVIGMIKPLICSKLNIAIIIIGFVLAFFVNVIFIILATIIFSTIYSFYKLHKGGYL
ncbi:MAG: chromate transporter [Clostridia bacterium]